MDDLLAVYRRRATDAEVRANTAPATATSAGLQLDQLMTALAQRQQEIERLRALLQMQQAQITDLRNQLAAALAARRRIDIESLARSVAGAMQNAEASLEGRTMAGARAEIRADLSIEGADVGVSTGATLSPPESLSTFSFDFRPIPPSPVAQAELMAWTALRSAVLEVQRALDRDYRTEAATRLAGEAMAQSGSLIATLLSSHTLAGVGVLITTLSRLATEQSELQPPMTRLSERIGRVPAAPTTNDVRQLADALTSIATALDALG